MLDVQDNLSDLQALGGQQARHNEALQAQVPLLTEQLNWLKKQLFGARSERMVADLVQQSLPFAGAEGMGEDREKILAFFGDGFLG